MKRVILAIDVGGTNIKALLFNSDGVAASERLQIATPHPAKPDVLIAAIIELAQSMGEYDRLAIGFPSVVEQGVTRGAINLHPDWDGFPLAEVLQKYLDKPVRIANDADVQGCGAIAGQGVELAVTLGTGFGSALFLDGQLLPNLELGQHIFRDRQTYEDCLGQFALDRVGIAEWNLALQDAIKSLYKLFNYRQLYIGGGNARLITIPIPDNVAIVSNDLGLIGGLALWR